MQQNIQSPAIGNALREFLSLDAAGSLPMVMEQVVIPVCVVGDVTAELDRRIVGYSNWRNVAPVAARFSKAMLEVPAGTSGVRMVHPRRILIRVAAACSVFWRLGQSTIGVTSDAVPRRLNASVPTAPGVARVVGADEAAAITYATMNGSIAFIAAGVFEWIPPFDMFLEPHPTLANSLAFECDTANVRMDVSCEWEETRTV